MRTEYKILNDFISNHSEIIINKNEIAIPQWLRDEFYRRFDDVRRAIVEEHYPDLPVDVAALCDNYIRIEKEIMDRLGLERICAPMDLFSFLHNPKDGLIRAVYTRLFDLLQGKITAEDFERQAEQDLRSAAADLFRLGYEMWAALAFIKLLDPDRGFFVDLDPDYKPILADLKEIAFGRQAHHPTIRIPEFAIHSRRLDRYVAVKMALAKEVQTFVVPFTPPVRPKKKTGDTSSALDSRVMLLYFRATPDDIPMVAEIYERKLTSPDLLIEFMTESEFSDPAALDEVKQHLNALRPKLGMSLFLIGAGGGVKAENIADNIQTISAGFDSSKMEPVLEQLG